MLPIMNPFTLALFTARKQIRIATATDGRLCLIPLETFASHGLRAPAQALACWCCSAAAGGDGVCARTGTSFPPAINMNAKAAAQCENSTRMYRDLS
jgi:hypothetical protein